jgi:hypothetical protein
MYIEKNMPSIVYARALPLKGRRGWQRGETKVAVRLIGEQFLKFLGAYLLNETNPHEIYVN